MACKIAAKFPLASFPDRIFHLRPFDFQSERCILLESRRFHAIDAFVIAHRNSLQVSERSLDCGLTHHGMSHFIPQMTREVVIELPRHTRCFAKHDGQPFSHVDLRKPDPKHVNKMIRDILWWRFYIIPDTLDRRIATGLSLHSEWPRRPFTLHLDLGFCTCPI